ncbi:MAG: 3,8-cyclase, partial [Verrucomicrobiota bacterium]
MPGELHEWLPREEVLTFEETWRLVRIAAELGVSKIRITGGEPLTRRDVVDLVSGVANTPGIRDIGLSTNATLLPKFAHDLRTLGVRSVNISLDTLDRQFYSQITGRDFLPQVLAGISAAIDAGFEQIKLNCVLMRGRNEDQLAPLIEFASERNLILRFIEL